MSCNSHLVGSVSSVKDRFLHGRDLIFGASVRIHSWAACDSVDLGGYELENTLLNGLSVAVRYMDVICRPG